MSPESAGPERQNPEPMRDDTFPMRQWGLPEPGELDRIVIVSPHLDDAVLGCGQLMAAHPGVTVVTVFAGNPPRYPDPMRVWDVQSGFAPGDDVMEVRRKEDHAALAFLDATPVHLDYIEYTYNEGDQPVPFMTVVEGLLTAVTELQPTLLLVPFGLANPDHDVTYRACMFVANRVKETTAIWCYEDHGYKHIPGMLAWRISKLFGMGLWPTPVCPPVDGSTQRKMQAVECYGSQLLALEDDWQIRAKLAAPAPEQYWRVAPPPPGWEGLKDA